MKRLLLVGGGHAHLYVLEALAREPLAGVEVLLVSPHARQLYSGMLPGWIAGHHPLEACALSLSALAARAGVRLVQLKAVGLNLARKQLTCVDDSVLDFDWISLDIGSTTAAASIAGAAEHALPVRPVEKFIAGLERILAQGRSNPDFPLVIIGGGVAAVEVAFAIQHRITREGRPPALLQVIGSGGLPLGALARRLQWKCLDLMNERSINWHAGSRVTRLDGEHAILADGTRIAAGAALLMTGAAAPRWPAQSGLACNAEGFVEVLPSLQSRSHDFVFAAGDIAAYAQARPKSGVFAVRAGPALAANLRRAVSGQALADWRPQQRALYLVSTGDQFAMAAWGSLGWWGEWVWRWKARIDRDFMRRFATPESV